MEEPRKALALVRIEKAEHCIESANLMIASDFYLDAANRSYYAIFHAMRSVLALEAKDFSKHAGVISYFRKNFQKKLIKVLDFFSSGCYTVHSQEPEPPRKG